MTVLIVDDDARFRKVVKKLLTAKSGMNVVGEAGDGEEAVQLTRELQPDLVLMDIGMPRLDGLAATRRIKDEVPDVKIVILTVHDEAPYRSAGRICGADAYLLKKTLVSELLQEGSLASLPEASKLLDGRESN